MSGEAIKCHVCGTHLEWHDCTNCDGDGMIGDELCNECDGSDGDLYCPKCSKPSATKKDGK